MIFYGVFLSKGYKSVSINLYRLLSLDASSSCFLLAVIYMYVGEAVVLAAGIGSRLGRIARGAKFAVKVAGRPLIQYPVLSLASAGVRRVVVVTRSAVLPLARMAMRGVQDVVDVRFCVNNEWYRENGYSLYVASRCVRSNVFYVSMSDHIYPAWVPRRLAEAAREYPDAVALVAGDREPRFVDVDEATRIRSRDGLVEAIGKGVSPWDYVDMGVFVMRREIFEVAARVAGRKATFGLSDVLMEAVSSGFEVRVVDVTGAPWVEVDTPSDYWSLVHGSKREVLSAAVESWSEPLISMDGGVRRNEAGEEQ